MTTFDTDWFSYAIPNCTAIKQQLAPIKSILEIGMYQGRSTCWMLENMLEENGHITCVDPFIDTDDSTGFDLADVPKNSERERLFRKNVAETKKSTQTMSIMVERSFTALSQLIISKKQYDFIYIDGNHAAPAVFADACMTYGLLRVGGVMLFDGYLWDHAPNHYERPKMSVDAFVNTFADRVTPIITNYQLALTKVK